MRGAFRARLLRRQLNHPGNGCRFLDADAATAHLFRPDDHAEGGPAAQGPQRGVHQSLSLDRTCRRPLPAKRVAQEVAPPPRRRVGVRGRERRLEPLAQAGEAADAAGDPRG